MFTLQEAADRLKVHYMTAYRWVRRGDLPAFKAGGRLRIRSADLEEFVAQRQIDTALPREGQRTDWPLHLDRLHGLLRAGDAVEATSLVRKVIADGAPVGDVYVRLLAPALERIGDEWGSDDLCISEEHRATEIVSGIIKRHSDMFRRRGAGRGSAVTMAAPDDLHALGAGMVGDYLRAGGYDVDYLGAGVPVDDLAVFLQRAPADVVCVSVTNGGRAPEMYAAVTETVREVNDEAVVVFGGQAADAAAAAAAGALHFDGLSGLYEGMALLAPH